MRVVSRSVAVACLAWTTLVAAQPQTTVRSAPDTPRRFEVASVKRNYVPTLLQRARSRIEPSRFTATNTTLRSLVRIAYGTSVDAQIVGGPEWIGSAEFDVVATAPNASPADIRLMLRQLLADRFSILARTEARQLPVLRLQRTNPKGPLPPGLTLSACDPAAPSAGGPCNTIGFGSSVLVTAGITMPRLAALLPGPYTDIDRVVVDETGLTDVYTFQLRFAPTRQLPGLRIFDPDADLPSFPTALREQLGLTLQAGTAPVTVVVIDRADYPTPD